MSDAPEWCKAALFIICCQEIRVVVYVQCIDVMFFVSGMYDEMQSALSSPGLDSPNSSADITLDTTGELTVEDVKDFLV